MAESLPKDPRHGHARPRLPKRLHDDGTDVDAAIRSITELLWDATGLEPILDLISERVVSVGLLRSLAIALVDWDTQSLRFVSDCSLSDGRAVRWPGIVGRAYELEADDATCWAARSGECLVIDGNDRRFDPEVTLGDRTGQTAIFLPLIDQGRAIAVLNTGCDTRDRDVLLARLQTMRPLLRQVTVALRYGLDREASQAALREARAALRRGQDLDRLLADVSALFIALPAARIDAQIEDVLGRTGRLLGLERCSVGCMSDDGARVDLTHLWNRGPIEALRQSYDVAAFPWMYGAFTRGEPVSWTADAGASDISAAEDAMLRAAGMASVLIVPVHIAGVPSAGMAFLHRHGDITVDQDRLHLLTRIVGNALARKAQAEALERAATIIDTTTDAVITTDVEGIVTSWNHGAQPIYGYTAEEMVGASIARIYDEEDRAFLASLIARLRAGEILPEVEARQLTRDGRVVEVLLALSVVRDAGGIICELVGILKDITERKAADAAYREVQRSLRESSRLIAMGQLAAAMAHELNQPLTVVSTLAEGLQLRLEQGLHPSQADLLAWSRDTLGSVDRMQRLIEHLRAFARDRRGEARDAISPRRVVDDALRFLRVQLASQGIALTVEVPDLPPVRMDPYGIEQVLVNLLTNARDAVRARAETQPAPPMAIHVRGHREPGRVLLEVEDNGIGIPEAARKQLFEPFFTTKGDEGLGLGLAISQEIVTEHGGRLEAEALQPGTRFRLCLPLVD